MHSLELFTRKNPLWKSWDHDLDRIFDGLSSQEFYTPACEIRTDEKTYHISLDMPGMKQENIDVEVKDNNLHITGERKADKISEKDGLVRSERKYGKFARVFSLPQDVNTDGISARIEDGVLEVVLPKDEKAGPKKISINGSKKDETVTLS